MQALDGRQAGWQTEARQIISGGNRWQTHWRQAYRRAGRCCGHNNHSDPVTTAVAVGASPLFKGRVVAVVGGGDSACEEAVYLTKYASHVSFADKRIARR